MTLHVKNAGSWKEVIDLQVKDGGTWKTVTNAYVKDGGSWKEFFNSATSYDYSIIPSILSLGSNTSTYDIYLNSSAATGEVWTVTFVSSNPPGFYDSHTVGPIRDNMGIFTLTSNCITASVGTRVILKYNISCSIDPPDTVEPTVLEAVHQF